MNYDENKVDKALINSTLGKMAHYLHNHKSICVGVSGGSDSNIIVHMIATYFRQYLNKVHFVFQNTGLEYRATLRHIKFMEEHYNITIDKIRPALGEDIVSTVRKCGVPILSKEYSKWVSAAQRGLEYGFKRIERTKEESSHAMSQKQKNMAYYLVENKIPVSEKCCNLAKKKPFHKYERGVKADLEISGVRQCENGARSTAYTSCFSEGKNGKIDRFMPLFYWNDDTKQYYKEAENIVYSDCYEVWGMKRTGCVGCPFNSRAGRDLEMIKKYEPNLYKACINVFGESYRLMDKFEIHREPIFAKYEQINLFEEQPTDMVGK